MTSWPFVRRTLATLRSAELGFLGVVVYTRVQTPRFCGELPSAGTLLFASAIRRGPRISWLTVDMQSWTPDPGREKHRAALRRPGAVFVTAACWDSAGGRSTKGAKL